MNRVTYINIAGKNYPLIFSLAAAKALTERFGDLSKMDEVLKFEKIDFETLDAVAWTLTVLIKQGVAYMNEFHSNIPVLKDVAHENGAYIDITQEELEKHIGFKSTIYIDAIYDALVASQYTEIETESKKQEAPKEE